jgi:glycosyltransferase involved in cell wall biosynthesis
MKFIFISSPSFEPWDWTNPDIQGIGGSETSHIEMSNRLSDRGHQVHSYAPTPFEDRRINPHGVKWEQCKFARRDHDGVWIVYRDPVVIDGIPEGQPIWLICQDVDYPTLTPERAARLTRIVALCETHGKYLRAMYPSIADKVFVSSNGIKAELIKKALENPPKRNPRRLIYASSPDRGLLHLAQIFGRAREIVPDLELHFYYGFDNIQKVEDRNPRVRALTNRIRKAVDQPGIEHHGRTGQPELIQEWLKAGIWCHPSSFTETSCITCMDAQALGAVPITTPTWAIGENVEHGVFIEGDPYDDELTRARYALELVRLALDPIRQERIREAMMPWALERFGWERFVDQWEEWASEDMYYYWSGEPMGGEAETCVEAKA